MRHKFDISGKKLIVADYILDFERRMAGKQPLICLYSMNGIRYDGGTIDGSGIGSVMNKKRPFLYRVIELSKIPNSSIATLIRKSTEILPVMAVEGRLSMREDLDDFIVCST